MRGGSPPRTCACGEGPGVLRWRVRLFAAAADALGAREVEVVLPAVPTAAGLLRHLAERGGDLLLRCAVACDGHLLPAAAEVPPGADVAVLPPVSGGAATLGVGPEPLHAEDVLAALGSAELGAQVLFLGTVRGSTDGSPTRELEYEAYSEMALTVLADIAARAESRWPGCRLAMRHRTGTLRPGEAAVVVAAAAAHRGDAFAAARYCIERLKVELPVWKKQVSPGGAGVWVDHP